MCGFKCKQTSHQFCICSLLEQFNSCGNLRQQALIEKVTVTQDNLCYFHLEKYTLLSLSFVNSCVALLITIYSESCYSL